MGFNTYPSNPWPMSTEKSGNGDYDLPIASADTIGGVKVGNGLSINAETGVLSADSQIVDYSTTEQATGQKWIDGKDIYFRTYSNLSISMTKNEWVSLGIDLSGIDYWRVDNEFMNDRQYPLHARNDNNALQGLCQYDVTLSRFTLYYTKTT